MTLTWLHEKGGLPVVFFLHLMELRAFPSRRCRIQFLWGPNDVKTAHPRFSAISCAAPPRRGEKPCPQLPFGQRASSLSHWV